MTEPFDDYPNPYDTDAPNVTDTVFCSECGEQCPVESIEMVLGYPWCPTCLAEWEVQRGDAPPDPDDDILF